MYICIFQALGYRHPWGVIILSTTGTETEPQGFPTLKAQPEEEECAKETEKLQQGELGDSGLEICWQWEEMVEIQEEGVIVLSNVLGSIG